MICKACSRSPKTHSGSGTYTHTHTHTHTHARVHTSKTFTRIHAERHKHSSTVTKLHSCKRSHILPSRVTNVSLQQHMTEQQCQTCGTGCLLFVTKGIVGNQTLLSKGFTKLYFRHNGVSQTKHYCPRALPSRTSDTMESHKPNTTVQGLYQAVLQTQRRHTNAVSFSFRRKISDSH